MAQESPILARDPVKLEASAVPSRPTACVVLCPRLPTALPALRRVRGNGGQPIAQPRTFVPLAHLKTLKLRLSLFNRPGQNCT
jgi:hypothetical protein